MDNRTFDDLKHAYNTAGEGEKEYVIMIFELCKSMSPPLKMIELGTGVGSTLMPMAIACRNVGGKVYTFDKSSNVEATDKVTYLGIDGYVEFKIMDDMYDEALHFLQQHEQTFNIILIDTSHTYHDTVKEIERYSQFLVDGGYMIFHDTSPLVNLPHGEYGIRNAIVEFLQKNSSFIWALDIHNGIGRNAGLGVIRKVEK